MVPGAIIWLVWKEKNRRILEGKELQKDEDVDLIHARMVHWLQKRRNFRIFKRKCDVELGGSPRWVGERREEAQPDVLPNSGWVKFNVDRETEGKSGPAGIGGGS